MRDPRNIRVYICFVVLAAALRLWGGRLTVPIQRFFANPEVASFILYLETGRAVHVSAPLETTAPPPETTVPPETTEETQPPKGPLVLSKADVSSVNIRNSGGIRVDGEELLLSPLLWDLTDGEDRVLLFHTHATESYTPTAENAYEASSFYRTLESEDNMLRIGETLARLLRAEGIGVIHDQTLHDYPSYNGSYSNSRRTMKKHLEQAPGLCLLLDLHRDALETESGKQIGKSITVDGRSVAQIMLVVGTNAGGLQHPDWEQNLALALKLQRQLETICPGICRYISLRTERFNQDLSPGAVLVEVGTAGNTLEEALAATEILAQAITALAQGCVTADSTS